MGLGIPPTTIALICVANLSILALNVAFLIDWIRNWRHVKAYWAYGLAAGLGSLAFAFLAAVAGFFSALQFVGEPLPPGWEAGPAPSGEEGLIFLIAGLLLIALGLLICLISASRLAGFTMLGMHHAASLGHPSFRLLLWLRQALAPAAADRALPPGTAAAGGEATAWPAAGPPEKLLASVASPALPPAGGQVATPPVTGRWPYRDYALSTLGVAVAALVYSVALFRLAPPRIAEVLVGLPGYTPERAQAFTLQVLVTVLAAAFSEEIVYRLGIQSFFARYLNCRGGRYWIPVVLASFLWTLGHAGAMEPAWVKLAQIFPIGLMLGWLYRRHGVESCMLAHALFNLALAPLTSYLIAG